MKTIESLKLLNAWVDPELPVQAAKMLLSGYKAAALPVSEGGLLQGLITATAVAGADESEKVRQYMIPAVTVIEGDTPIREVAQIFLDQQLEYAPVVSEGRSLGIVTARMLLGELSLSYDPRTGLSWDDHLREWGVENLKAHREVTIIFIDLDDFGLFNKEYDHSKGDEVIRAVVSLIESQIDSELDLLVRYGGDEFAIGSIRNREDADELAERLEQMQSEITIPGVSRPVRFSAGVFGGRRTKERENAHYESTIDNLINRASQAALAHKKAKKAAEEETAREAATPAPAPVAPVPTPTPTPAPGPSPAVANRNARLVEVLVDENAPNSMTTVILSLGEGVTSGVSARMGGSVSLSVAQAAAKALERAYPGIGIRVDDVHLMNGREGERIASVRLQITESSGVRTGSGAVGVREDVYFSVAGATLEAFYGPV